MRHTTTDFFFYGTLSHPPLLAIVLGRAVAMQPAALPGYHVACAAGQVFPLLVADAGSVAQGVLVRGLTEADVARLDYYEAGFAFDRHDLTVQAQGPVPARVYIARPGEWEPVGNWSLAQWQAAQGATVTETARDVMGLFGQHTPEQMLARYPLMLIRGASRVRAARGGPVAARHAMQPGDVPVAARTTPYARFFAVEEYDLQFRRFDGTLGPMVNRAVFISGDAVTVLPYDPVRDVVLLIEQFRPGPFARGDAQPWSLEAIAGRIDAGETPEQAARREAVEEAGLVLGAMEYVGGYYPTPGAKAEFLYSYVALTDLPEGVEGVFGVEGEAEDIRGHRMDFAAFAALIASGEVNNAPLLLTGLWLQRERARLLAAPT
jgi:ADP-ribose pyrophosphatase